MILVEGRAERVLGVVYALRAVQVLGLLHPEIRRGVPDGRHADKRLGWRHLVHDVVPWRLGHRPAGDDFVLKLSKDRLVDPRRSDLLSTHRWPLTPNPSRLETTSV